MLNVLPSTSINPLKNPMERPSANPNRYERTTNSHLIPKT